MALGADGARVVQTVMFDGLRPVAVGLALGLVGALAFSRVLSSVLFQVAATDPSSFLYATALLALVAVVAWRARLAGQRESTRQSHCGRTEGYFFVRSGRAQLRQSGDRTGRYRPISPDFSTSRDPRLRLVAGGGPGNGVRGNWSLMADIRSVGRASPGRIWPGIGTSPRC